jgi:alginate O-acetyltransferase complex protein AlgJ
MTTHAPPPDPLAPETPLGPEIDDPGSRRLRYAFAALALAFLMLPPLLAIAGVSGGPLQRERLAKAPDLGNGWAAFDEAGDYVTQRLPFRAQGVDANTWIANKVWGRAPDYGRSGPGKALPFEGVQASGGGKGGYNQTGGTAKANPVVSTGRDGWLFLQGEIDTLCRPPVGFDAALLRWTQLVQEVRASRRKVVLLVAPEKSTVYPEKMTPNAPGWACAQRNKARLWSALRAQKDPDIVPLLDPLLELKRRDPSHLLYLRLNSHWNGTGAVLLPEKGLERVGGPVQVRPRDVHLQVRSYPTDIGAFVGRSGASERARFVQIDRPGEAPFRDLTKKSGVPLFTHPGGPRTVLPGNTLFIHDSFGDRALPMFPHYASRLVSVSWINTSPAVLEKLIRASDTVIIETVERDFLNRAAAGKEGAVLTPDFLRDLRNKLGAPPHG